MQYKRTIQTFITQPVIRLASSYLLIIMLMSIGFSVIFYNTSAHELGRQLPPEGTYRVQGDIDQPFSRYDRALDSFFQNRIAEGRRALQGRLIALNILTLLLGGIFSYLLARRTLRPIERNMEAQSQFVSDASHELRTPLTALRTSNEVALRQPTLSKRDTKELLQQNIQDVIKLQALTDSLLRLARQDPQAALPVAPVSMQDIVTDAVTHAAEKAVEKDITIEDTTPRLHIMADRASVAQLIGILLDNAIKYSPSHTTVHLHGGSQGHQGYITVADQGYGIDAADLPHIFDRFYRADQSRNKAQAEGFGIGLALARKIANSQHGEIAVTSEPGKGSTFTVTFPLAK